MAAAEPEIPALTGRVIDTAGLMSEKQENALLDAIEQHHKVATQIYGYGAEASGRFGGGILLTLLGIFIAINLFSLRTGALIVLIILFFMFWVIRGFPAGGIRQNVWNRATAFFGTRGETIVEADNSAYGKFADSGFLRGREGFAAAGLGAEGAASWGSWR